MELKVLQPFRGLSIFYHLCGQLTEHANDVLAIFYKFLSLNYTDCHHLQLMDISIIIYSNSSIGFFLELVAMLSQFKSSKVIN